MKKISVLFVSILVVLLLMQCNNETKTDSSKAHAGIHPVPLPVIVPGFHFPEDSTVIYSWVNNSKFPNSYDSVNIFKHAWGIWAGLTDTTNQHYAGDRLLVFETWMGLSDIRDAILANKSTCDSSFYKTERTPLSRPKQFEHAANFASLNATRNTALKKILANSPKHHSIPEPPYTQWVTVSYSPDAACFAGQNQIFKISVINKSYQSGGVGNIANFPNSSLTIKPTYLVYKDTAALLQLPVWLNNPNPPDSLTVIPNQFPYCVYIDVRNHEPEHKKIVPASVTDTSKEAIKKATCNLKDFISFHVDQKMAAFMNKQDSIQGLNHGGKATAGAIAVLVGMHVTTKEINNWTWQSYYWTPDPENPGTPSSKLAAANRPSQLVGAAAHYAMCAAYTMLTPNGATNSTSSAGPMIAFNPYLEGGFGPTTFGITNTFNANYVYGMQTNCMSCHALAVPQTPTVAGQTFGQYTTDQFINLQADSLFKNQVRLDFAWSIQTALIKDTVPYWDFKALQK